MIEFPVSGVHTYWWLPMLVAFFISFFTSMGGLSGAFMLMPFQVSILGYTTPSVSATNLVYNVIAIPGGVYRFIREKRLVWPLVTTIIIGTLPGLLIGAYIRIRFLADPKSFKLFVGLVLFYIVVRLTFDILKKRQPFGNAGDFVVKVLHYSSKSLAYEFNGHVYHASSALIFLMTLGVGVIGGAYGIGGGAIVAPFLVAAFSLPVYTVAGAALFGTFISSVAGVLIYSYILPLVVPGQIPVKPDLLLGLSFGVGGFVGIYLGARAQRYFPARFIKLVLAVSLVVIVVKYVGGYFLE